MQIESDFEGGRIAVGSIKASLGGGPLLEAELDVPGDTFAPNFRQWFCFVARGAFIGKRIAFRVRTGDCTWHDTFGGHYRVHASYDDQAWFRLPTRVEGESIVAEIVPDRERVKIAYYPPYAEARLLRLLERARNRGGLTVAELGRTPHGRPLHLVSSEEAPVNAPALWIIAQQHPGEYMASWFVEGLLEALQANRAANLRARARVFVVPRMNPDGCAAGNHRTNAAGIDLNREWNLDDSCAAEVAMVRAEMEHRGASFFLDVHGDERLPYVFLQPADQWPGRDPHLRELEARFFAAMLRRAPDFQTEHCYSHARPGTPYLPIAANWVQHRFGCLALTLEMPFSDNALAPRDEGWSPGRSRQLGWQTLEAIATVTARGFWRR